MSIIRVIAIDPEPRVGSHSDVLVYQVPENSREYEVLLDMLTAARLEWTKIDSSPRKNGKATP